MDNNMNYKFYFQKGLNGVDAIKEFMVTMKIILKILRKRDSDVYIDISLKYATQDYDFGFDVLEFLDENLDPIEDYNSIHGNSVLRMASHESQAWLEKIPQFPMPELPIYFESENSNEVEYSYDELLDMIEEQSKQLKELTAEKSKKRNVFAKVVASIF